MAVLKETIQQLCSNGKTRSPSLSDAGGDSRGEKQGYLEMNGSRSKLFIVVSADRVFLYLNSEVLVWVFHRDGSLNTNINVMFQTQCSNIHPTSYEIH